MEVSASLGDAPLKDVPGISRKYEKIGCDIIDIHDTKHDPFLSLALAAEHTRHVALRTSVAIAFPRSPMTIAYSAWDIQRFSEGRLTLGLGSQVRGHIVRRFSAPWVPPAPRMREYVTALRAIWDCWQNGTKLKFQGDYYSFSLMTPFFDPGSIEHPNIPIYISAMNQNMLRVAGEVCDGLLIHPFTSLKYVKEVILPDLETGAERAGRSLEDVEVSGGGFIVTGETEEGIAKGREAVRSRIAFYASTLSYRPVMSVHGWDDTVEKLYRMSVEGQWDSMRGEITDEMVDTFALIGTYDDIVDKIKARYGDYACSIDFSLPVDNGNSEGRLEDVIKQLKSL